MTGSTVMNGRVAIGFALGAAVLWPAVEVLSGPPIEAYDFFGAIWIRYAMQMLILVVAGCVLVRPFGAMVRTRRPLLQLLRGVAMFAVSAFFVLAIQAGGFGWAATVLWSAPFLAVVGAELSGVSRMRWRTLAPMAVSLVGVVLLVGTGFGGLRSMAFAGLSASGLAGYLVLSRTLRHERIEASLFYTSLGALLLMTVMSGGGVWEISASEWPNALVLGAAGLGFLYCLDRSVEFGKVSWVAPILFLVPVIEPLIRLVVEGAPPDGIFLASAILVSAGVLLALLSENPGLRGAS